MKQSMISGLLALALLSAVLFAGEDNRIQPDRQQLAAKVEALESRVAQLEQRLQQLERQPHFYFPKQDPQKDAPRLPRGFAVPPGHAEPAPGRDWKPFEFNGQTYYLIPLEDGAEDAPTPRR